MTPRTDPGVTGLLVMMTLIRKRSRSGGGGNRVWDLALKCPWEWFKDSCS